jgi:hypothetical protein
VGELKGGDVANQDRTSANQAPEPAEGIPPAFKLGAVLFFVLLIVIAVVFAPESAIPD